MDITSFAVIFLAIAAGAIAKGATGMGMPLIATPFIASVYGLQQAVAVLIVPILVSNLWQAYTLRNAGKDPRVGFLLPMIGASVLGVAIGVWFLTTAPERGLTLLLGALLLAYLAFRLLRPDFSMGADTARRWAVPAGLAGGVLQGATSISAPAVVTFIHAMRLERKKHVFAVSVMFLALAVAQVPTMAIAGLLPLEWLLQGLFALIPIAIFMPVGQWLSAKLSQVAFDRMILAFLGVMGLKMVLGV